MKSSSPEGAAQKVLNVCVAIALMSVGVCWVWRLQVWRWKNLEMWSEKEVTLLALVWIPPQSVDIWSPGNVWGRPNSQLSLSRIVHFTFKFQVHIKKVLNSSILAFLKPSDTLTSYTVPTSQHSWMNEQQKRLVSSFLHPHTDTWLFSPL